MPSHIGSTKPISFSFLNFFLKKKFYIPVLKFLKCKYLGHGIARILDITFAKTLNEMNLFNVCSTCEMHGIRFKILFLKYYILLYIYFKK